MSPQKKQLSQDSQPMLSAKKAAKLLHCAPDYVGKLCREGKLKGERIDNAWFVTESSIAEFQKVRVRAKEARSQALATERREESERFRKINGLPAPNPVLSPKHSEAYV